MKWMRKMIPELVIYNHPLTVVEGDGEAAYYF